MPTQRHGGSGVGITVGTGEVASRRQLCPEKVQFSIGGRKQGFVALPIGCLGIALCVHGQPHALWCTNNLDLGIVVLGGMCLTKQTNRSEEHTSELQSHVNLVCRL